MGQNITLIRKTLNIRLTINRTCISPQNHFENTWDYKFYNTTYWIHNLFLLNRTKIRKLPSNTMIKI